MTKVVLIGDDLTGTLDSAVPFAQAGAVVIPMASLATFEQVLTSEPAVVAVNANTRHLDPVDAAACVEAFVTCAKRHEVALIVKKTDSVLRGNLGAELAAARAASGQDVLHFVPAFPTTGRTTEGGIQYVDGVAVAESSLGHDPFEPLASSRPAELIALQTAEPTIELARDEDLPAAFSGIAIYDASSDDEMDAICTRLLSQSSTLCLAGCAGIAQSLARALAIPAAPAQALSDTHLLAMCGSVNPVSQGQCAHAKAAGAPTFSIAEKSKLSPSWYKSSEAQALIDNVVKSWKTQPLTVVDASSFTPAGPTPTDGLRHQVATNLGELAARMVGVSSPGPVLIMGGDVLLGFLCALEVSSVRLVGELMVGVVMFEATLGDKPLQIISKSGGFGEPDLFTSLVSTCEKKGTSHAYVL